jgi:hypothetical protein
MTRRESSNVTLRVLAVGKALVLLSLALLHIYWAAGGKLGMASAIPTLGGKPVINPSVWATLAVAAALAAAAAITFASTGALQPMAPAWIVRSGLVVLTLVFAARCIGDFRLIGFTKQVHDTAFAQMDTFLYSPLCGLLALSCCALVVLGDP